MSALSVFTPETRAWFEQTFEAATPAQELGWPKIASGSHTLIQAPTGSGKTLAAFLFGLDRLIQEAGEGTRLVYVSPLKALNYDIERNLRGPLAGLQADVKVAVRTGDTSQKERAAMLRNPPDLLITTPESLFLMLTSRAREILAGVRTLILDEVHAVAGTKRGAHLAVTVERLERLTGEPFQRIALSATQRPLEEIGKFVYGLCVLPAPVRERTEALWRQSCSSTTGPRTCLRSRASSSRWNSSCCTRIPARTRSASCSCTTSP